MAPVVLTARLDSRDHSFVPPVALSNDALGSDDVFAFGAADDAGVFASSSVVDSGASNAGGNDSI